MDSCIKQVGCCAVILVTLMGCASSTQPVAPKRAPVHDINRAPPKMDGTHVVQQGDTFYTIAWRYNRDAQQLARINGLQPPYHLNVGQKIALGKAAPAQQQVAAASSKPWYSSPPVGSTNTALTAPTQAPKAAPVLPKGAIAWEWPTTGKIIGNFSSQNAQKGIDIAGQNGQPVITAAAGVVVYSGSGLRGYGQMVIVKHNDQFLSAYAHNSRLLVNEGDTVKAHAKIAEMGQTDTESVRLHFEIRKNGQPVDPLDYLPRRG
ncbi:MAG: peptidoglycan DD-metalloendopeptidase family protein [Gammaproteobacteria bacterium]